MIGPLLRAAAVGGLTLVAGAAACDDSLRTLEADPDTVPADSIVSVARRGAADLVVGRADGVDTAVIVATIPRDADARVVTFTTNLGTFADFTSTPRELKVRAEPAPGGGGRLVASVVLRAPDSLRTGASADTSTVRAAVGDFSAVVRVPLRCLAGTTCGRRASLSPAP